MKKISVFIIFILLFGFLFSATAFSQSLTSKDVYIYTNVVSKVYVSGHYRGLAKYRYKDKRGITWYYIKLKLKVGTYPLKIEANGYKTINTKIKIKSTGSNKFFYKLRKTAPTQTTTTVSTGAGRLVVRTDVPAWVYLNNIKLGKTPLDKKIKAGTYKMVLVPLDAQYPKKTMTIRIENGRTTTINVKFAKQEVYYQVKIITNTKAYVYINGQKQPGTTPLVLKLKKGTYQLKLVPIQPFYMPYNTTLNVSNNSVFNFNLNPMASKVYFNLPVNAVLYIDNRRINFNSSSFTLNLPVGTHKIKIVYYDFVIEKEINVKFNKQIKITLFMDFVVEE